jgi:hypothetical protein
MASADTSENDDTRAELQAAVPEAAETIRELLDAEDERIQLRAAEAILDRAGLSKAKAATTGTAQREIGGEPSKYGPGSDDPLENLF